jgi:hypothetical protein
MKVKLETDPIYEEGSVLHLQPNLVYSIPNLRSLNSVTASKSYDLETYKELGGRGTSINPITHRQVVSAFAKEFNSSRYEVLVSYSLSSLLH